MLELCPYCECEQADVERISPEIRAEIFEGLDRISGRLFMHGIPRLWRVLYWIWSLRILLLTLVFGGIAFSIIANAYLTAMLLVAGLALSLRPFISVYKVYNYSTRSFFEKSLWRFRLKRKVIKLLRRHKVPESELNGIMWDYLQNKKHGEQSEFRAALYD
jgi:hypothetical protein